MFHHRNFLKIALAVILIGWSQPAIGQYAQTDEIVTAGRPIKLNISQADTLFVTYRPGTSISETISIPVTGEIYEWTPRKAGIVALSTPGGITQNVSVRFNDFPVSGLIILLGAGIILFGGALLASIKLFGKETPEQVTARPDT